MELFREETPGTSFQPLLAVVAALLICAILFILFGPQQGSVAEQGNAGVEQAASQCAADRESCLGGFVKLKGNPTIFRMSYCEGYNCDSRKEIGLIRMGYFSLARFEYIVPPHTVEWDVTNRAYGLQFVAKSRGQVTRG